MYVPEKGGVAAVVVVASFAYCWCSLSRTTTATTARSSPNCPTGAAFLIIDPPSSSFPLLAACHVLFSTKRKLKLFFWCERERMIIEICICLEGFLFFFKIWFCFLRPPTRFLIVSVVVSVSMTLFFGLLQEFLFWAVGSALFFHFLLTNAALGRR